VVEPGRKEIAAGLRALVGLPEAELAAMGQRGRELARRLYDWSVLTPRYRQLYAAVAAGR
jgi:glycosyltransferase involved in cell wall biosynthesis